MNPNIVLEWECQIPTERRMLRLIFDEVLLRRKRDLFEILETFERHEASTELLLVESIRRQDVLDQLIELLELRPFNPASRRIGVRISFGTQRFLPRSLYQKASPVRIRVAR